MIAIISDIHSNFEALKAVLQDIDKHEISKIFCLGDLIGYGPEPEEVVNMIRKRNITTVIGNHEAQLSNLIDDMNDDALTALSTNEKLLSTQSIDYIDELPSIISKNNMLFVHGCPPDSYEEYFKASSIRDIKLDVFNSFSEQVAFIGHTHKAEISELRPSHIHSFGGSNARILHPQRRYIINCGSVGQQRGGIDNNAHYVIYNPSQMKVLFKQVQYDVSKTIEKMRARGISDEFAKGLLVGEYWNDK